MPDPRNFEQDFESASSNSRGAIEYDGKLFEELRELRRSIAAENGVPPYIVFGDATLQQMANYMPQNLNSLSHISGVGAVKLKQYGDDFLAVICEYARENNLPERPIRPQRQSRQRSESRNATREGSTYEQTKQLLAQGLSIEQVAQQRGLSRGTILGHIDRLVQAGETLDLRLYLPTPERMKKIQDALLESQSNSLIPVKEELGEDYTYGELRIVRAFMRQQATEEGDESKSYDAEQIRQ